MRLMKFTMSLNLYIIVIMHGFPENNISTSFPLQLIYTYQKRNDCMVTDTLFRTITTLLFFYSFQYLWGLSITYLWMLIVK